MIQLTSFLGAHLGFLVSNEDGESLERRVCASLVDAMAGD